MKVIGITDVDACGAMPRGVYLMSDSSLLKDRKPFFIPDFAESFEARPAVVLQIDRLGKNIAEKFAHRYYDCVALGLMLTARPMHDNLLAAGMPGDVAHAFDGSAILGAVQQLDSLQPGAEAAIAVDGNEQWRFRLGDAVCTFDAAVAMLSRYFTMKIGDLVFLQVGNATPLTLVRDMHITGSIGGAAQLDMRIK